MRRWTILLGTIVALRSLPSAATAGGWRGGVGVIGDSYSDEYQFYPPDRTTARCWVEILAESRGIDFGPFRDEPSLGANRRGYEYNWARSWATTDDMIAQGQHTGVAAQVARGEVGLVWIFIGGNDFINSLYSEDPPAVVESAEARATANLREAVRTVLDASPNVKVVVATVPDVCDLPEFVEAFDEGRLLRTWADATRAAIQRYNAAIWALRGEDPRLTVVDLFWPLKLAARFGPGKASLFGVKLDIHSCGNNLESGFLNDKRHAGLVLQAMLARLFLDTVNLRFTAGLEPLSEREVLAVASAIPNSPAHRNALVLDAVHDPLVRLTSGDLRRP